MAAARLKPCPSRAFLVVEFHCALSARNPAGMPPGVHGSCRGGAIAPPRERSERVLRPG